MKLEDRIILIAALTLAAVVAAVTIVLLVGLFDTRVDNNKVFDVIGPAFSMITGAFVGLIGGIALSNRKKDEA